VADLIIVKEYDSAYVMRGFGECTFKDRPVNCGKSALRLAYCVGIFLTMFGSGKLFVSKDLGCWSSPRR
jgi:hypothetical protein